MNTPLTGKTILSLALTLSLLLSGALLTACSGQGGFSFNFGQGQSGGGTAGFSPMLILILIVFLVALIAIVALGALGKK